MRVAICDDDISELAQLHRLLEHADGSICPLEVREYSNAVDLLHDAENGHSFDLVILDIMMPGLSGMDAARELRAANELVKIAFLTSTPEFAVESYDVHASNYLLKPVDPEKLYSTLGRLSAMLERPHDVITLEKPRRLVTVAYDQIEYVEIIGKTLYFMLVNSGEENVRAPLKVYEERLLSHPGFFKTHRSYIVNMSNMKELDSDSFISVSGRSIPIARALRKEAKEAYVRFLFEDAAQG